MKDTTFEEIAVEALADQRIKNLTPHPIRVFCHPFCFIGAKPDPDHGGWTGEVVNGENLIGGYVEIPPAAGDALRLGEEDIPGEDVEVGRFFDVPECQTGLMSTCSVRSYVAPAELPREKLGVVLIVSLPFAMGIAAAGVNRDDIVCPDTGPTAKRDADGHLTAVTGFIRVPTVAQLGAYRRGEQEGRRQIIEDEEIRGRNMATGSPVLSLDSRAEPSDLRKSFEHGARNGWNSTS